MAHYVSGRLPFRLPPSTRGLGQFRDKTVPMRQTTRPVSPSYASSFFDRTTVPAPTPGRRITKKKKKTKRRPLRHGDTVYCVYVGKKKLSCSRSKARAQKVADREKLKRAKKTGVRVKKQKYELRCPPGTRRVCKERKKGSRACKRMGCAKR